MENKADKSIVILKYDSCSSMPIEIHIINQPVKLLITSENKKCLQKLIEVVRLFENNQNITYKLDLINNKEIEETFNKQITSLPIIKESDTFEIFIIKATKELQSIILGKEIIIKDLKDAYGILISIKRQLNKKVIFK